MKNTYNNYAAASWLLNEDDEADDIVDAEDLVPEDDTDEQEDIADRLDSIEDKLDTLVSDKESDDDDDKVYDIDMANPVCPHCGARLNIVDDTQSTDNIDDSIIDGDFDTEEDTDDTEDFSTGDDISVSDEEENPEESEESQEGDEDYVNFDDIIADITAEDDDEDK